MTVSKIVEGLFRNDNCFLKNAKNYSKPCALLPAATGGHSSPKYVQAGISPNFYKRRKCVKLLMRFFVYMNVLTLMIVSNRIFFPGFEFYRMPVSGWTTKTGYIV